MIKVCTPISDCTEDRIFLYNKNKHEIFECGKCRHRFAEVKNLENHVAEVYSDEYFFKGKAGYPNYFNQKELLYNYGKDYAKIISKYIKPGKVLDTGCAAGFILKGFVDSGWNGTGVEPNSTMANHGRYRLNLNIDTGSFEAFESPQKFDLINMIQVIGHFYALDQAMLKLREILNESGMVLVESWNMKSGYARLMGKNWHEYSPPSVLRWFSDQTLCELFNRYGFTLIDKGYPPKKINIRHALSLIEEKSVHFKLKKRIFNKLNLMVGKYNVTYPFLDLKWYLFKMKAQ